MTKGVLSTPMGEARIGGDGEWQADDARLASALRSTYPPPPTEAGTPWVLAFWAAADAGVGKVVSEPDA